MPHDCPLSKNSMRENVCLVIVRQNDVPSVGLDVYGDARKCRLLSEMMLKLVVAGLNWQSNT